MPWIKNGIFWILQPLYRQRKCEAALNLEKLLVIISAYETTERPCKYAPDRQQPLTIPEIAYNYFIPCLRKKVRRAATPKLKTIMAPEGALSTVQSHYASQRFLRR